MNVVSNNLNSLVRNQQGNSLIEMAFALPILMVLLFGVVDISASYARKLTLEQAAQSGVEMVTAAGLASGSINQTTMASEIAEIAGVPSSGVAVTKWYQCGTTVQTSMTKCADGSTPATYWRVVVTEVYRPPLGFNMLSKGGQPVTLRGTAVVRGG